VQKLLYIALTFHNKYFSLMMTFKVETCCIKWYILSCFDCSFT